MAAMVRCRSSPGQQVKTQGMMKTPEDSELQNRKYSNVTIMKS